MPRWMVSVALRSCSCSNHAPIGTTLLVNNSTLAFINSEPALWCLIRTGTRIGPLFLALAGGSSEAAAGLAGHGKRRGERRKGEVIAAERKPEMTFSSAPGRYCSTAARFPVFYTRASPLRPGRFLRRTTARLVLDSNEILMSPVEQHRRQRASVLRKWAAPNRTASRRATRRPDATRN